MSNILPPNASSLERHVAKLTERLEQYPTDFQHTWHPDLCPVELLPWLAWAFSVDEWDANWSEAQKRKAINDSVFIHQHKGTRAAVERALSALPVESNIIEWFEQHPPANPYTFFIETTPSSISASLADTLIRLVNAAKNLRSHYILLSDVYVEGNQFVGGVVMSGQEMDIFYQGYVP